MAGGFNVPVPLQQSGAIGSEFVQALLADPNVTKGLAKQLGIDQILEKADTISLAQNFLYHDVSSFISFMYAYEGLTPLIGTLPRVRGIGNSWGWKRVTGININGVSSGVSEGNRGARIAIAAQEMLARFKTLGLESSVSFEARLSGAPFSPELLGISVQSALRSLRIDEEKLLVNGNSSMALGITPTPSLSAGTVTGQTGTFSGAAFVAAVALTGMAYVNYSSYSSVTGFGGVPGRTTKVNADGSSDTYGGGSAQPSAIATVTPTGSQCITATVTAVNGATNYGLVRRLYE
jgi:hypothetical protein